MNRLAAAHGEQPVTALDGATVEAFMVDAWGSCAPATWYRHVATLRSFLVFCRRKAWLAEDPVPPFLWPLAVMIVITTPTTPRANPAIPKNMHQPSREVLPLKVTLV